MRQFNIPVYNFSLMPNETVQCQLNTKRSLKGAGWKVPVEDVNESCGDVS